MISNLIICAKDRSLPTVYKFMSQILDKENSCFGI